MIESVKNVVSAGRLKLIQPTVQEALDNGATPDEILDSMMAAMDELNLGDDHAGIIELNPADVKTGQKFSINSKKIFSRPITSSILTLSIYSDIAHPSNPCIGS